MKKKQNNNIYVLLKDRKMKAQTNTNRVRVQAKKWTRTAAGKK